MMDIRKKILTIVLFTFFLTFAVITPSMTNAQTTSHYGDKVGESGANLVGFDLTIYNPISQDVYTNTLPLNFNIHWSPVGVSPYFGWTFAGLYTYSIDNKPSVNIGSNKSSTDQYGGNSNFVYNPSFSYSLDISNLTDGQHIIVISAGFYYNNSGRLMWDFCNKTSSPIVFSLQNSISPKTPAVPEFSWLILLPLFIFMLSIAVTVRLRKTWRITQH